MSTAKIIRAQKSKSGEGHLALVSALPINKVMVDLHLQRRFLEFIPYSLSPITSEKLSFLKILNHQNRIAFFAI